MRIRPTQRWQHAGYLSNTALDTDKIYEAIPATNQPDWARMGKVFVECPNGAPDILLERGDYEIVDDSPERTNE